MQWVAGQWGGVPVCESGDLRSVSEARTSAPIPTSRTRKNVPTRRPRWLQKVATCVTRI